MPVEIKELIIRATVSGGSERGKPSASGMDGECREEIIEACVEQVLKILERSRER